MHELSLAQSLLDIVLKEAERNRAARVTKVGVKIGAFTHVVPSSLIFCFDLIKEDTVAGGASLVISKVPLRGRCGECGQEFEMPEPTYDCPACSSVQVQVIQGQELTVDYIEVEDPKEESSLAEC
ncbi:MAG: hydrogenase maturation nickel metallochaperone HypA [Desulfarculaceae bacterium]|jgi:hydrogenase nickel incorporation protein HypA/HybF